MPDRFAHAMPFGAEFRNDGHVRFRLWAPSVERLDLVLDSGGAERRLPMEPQGDGWFEHVTDQAGPGSHYRYVLPDGLMVPDPASRWQAHDVHGPSTVVDPTAYAWRHPDFKGRPWEETVLYELHVGTFTPQGTFAAVKEKLDHLERLGVTALELMPLAEFPGRRGWGYDGVLPYAPEGAYGTPDDLKDLIDAIHERGMMVFLDVVYNHFGPEGNYLHAYAKPFFTSRHPTPWGDGINYDGEHSRPVRDFVIHNALYWLEEFRFDGLRLDAVHAIMDDSERHLLTELAETVRARIADRQVHLILENEANQAHRLVREADGRPRHFTAQWADDWHNSAHVLLTGETNGYYADYAKQPAAKLVRALSEGFVYQGEVTRNGHKRGEPSAELPPPAFVTFLQNHDQIGNRAMGERLTRLADPRALRTLTAIQLLSPQIPLLFMGEEWGSRDPFLFFCDFHGELADAVREGRRKEFASFPAFADPEARKQIPDPIAEKTFQTSCLDWSRLNREEHEDWLAHYMVLLKLRHSALVPRLAKAGNLDTTGRSWDERALFVGWRLGDGAWLSLVANLGQGAREGFERPPGDLLFETEEGLERSLAEGRLPEWSAAFFLTGGTDIMA